MTLLIERALVLAKTQTAQGTPATTNAAQDAMLAAEPAYSVDPKVLERKYAKGDHSPLAHLIGRKLAMISFSLQFSSNKKCQSGLVADNPRLVRLVEACGFEIIQMDGTGAKNVMDPVPDDENSALTPTVVWTKGGTLAVGHTSPVLFTLTITGASNAYTLSRNDGGADATGTLTTAVALALGTGSVTVTPTFTGTLPTGTKFRILVLPKGVRLKPITVADKYLTLEAYFDGLKHQITDAQGTLKFNAEAGDYCTFDFEFTGNYVPVTDVALPEGTFEDVLPPQVENANLTWGSKNDLVVNAFSFDNATSVVPRSDVNSPNGYKGVRISGRTPVGGIDPEATLEASNPFWADFSAARRKVLVGTVGTEQGNRLVIYGPQVQVSDQKYGDREQLRTYDLSIGFKRFKGDDEVSLFLV